MSNIYDNYIEHSSAAVNHEDRCRVVFDTVKSLNGRLDRIYKNDKDIISFDFSFSIGTGVVYYFGIKPQQIIINNDSKKMEITADWFLISSIDIDRKSNRYIMTIEAKNEKYIRN